MYSTFFAYRTISLQIKAFPLCADRINKNDYELFYLFIGEVVSAVFVIRTIFFLRKKLIESNKDWIPFLKKYCNSVFFFFSENLIQIQKAANIHISLINRRSGK